MFSNLDQSRILLFGICLSTHYHYGKNVGRLVVLGFNVTLTAKVISWQQVTLSHTSANTTFFSKLPTTFLTCFCRGARRKNTPERRFTSTMYQTHNHQVMSLTRSPLSHPGGAQQKCGFVKSESICRQQFTYGSSGRICVQHRKKYGIRRKCWLPTNVFHSFFLRVVRSHK